MNISIRYFAACIFDSDFNSNGLFCWVDSTRFPLKKKIIRLFIFRGIASSTRNVNMQDECQSVFSRSQNVCIIARLQWIGNERKLKTIESRWINLYRWQWIYFIHLMSKTSMFYTWTHFQNPDYMECSLDWAVIKCESEKQSDSVRTSTYTLRLMIVKLINSEICWRIFN